MGVFLLGWTIFTGMMLLVTFRVSVAHIVLFFFLFMTFLFLTVGDLQGEPSMKVYGGWLGLITAIIAWYIALAQVLAASRSPIKLPSLFGGIEYTGTPRAVPVVTNGSNQTVSY